MDYVSRRWGDEEYDLRDLRYDVRMAEEECWREAKNVGLRRHRLGIGARVRASSGI